VSGDEHEIRITSLRETDRMSLKTGKWISKTKYRAICACGWTSTPRATRAAADAEGDDHRMAIRD
jgi:hypothetical protein